MAILETDSYTSQRARIERIVKEIAPGKRLEFDEESTFVKFRILDPVSGVTLMVSSGEWFPHELAEKSDVWITAMIRNHSNGMI